MAQLQPLSARRHGSLRWRRARSYAFAEGRAVVPVVASELPRAAGSFPLAFTPRGEGFTLSAVLGIEPEHNLYVRPDGRWRGSYVPAYLRGHPFYLAEAEGSRRVVAVDESSDLLTEDDPEGEPVFDAEGKPTEASQPVIDFLERVARSRAATERACRALAEHGLIEPWSVSVADAEGRSRRLEGLYRVREAALGGLGGEALAELRDRGALRVAYAQVLAQSQIRRLTTLARQHAREASRRSPANDIDFSQIFGEDDGLRFEWDD